MPTRAPRAPRAPRRDDDTPPVTSDSDDVVLSGDELRNALRQVGLSMGLTSGEAERFAGDPEGDWRAGYRTGKKKNRKRQQTAAGGSAALQVGADENWATLSATLLEYMSPDMKKKITGVLASQYPEILKTGAPNPVKGESRERDLTPYQLPKDGLTPEEKLRAAGLVPLPSETGLSRRTYMSKEKARRAKEAMQNMLKATGKKKADFGPGYKFLTNVLSMLEKHGGTEESPMTTAQYDAFQQEITGALQGAESQRDLASFVPLAQALTSAYVGGENPFELNRDKRLYR